MRSELTTRNYWHLELTGSNVLLFRGDRFERTCIWRWPFRMHFCSEVTVSNVLVFGGDRFECTFVRRWQFRIYLYLEVAGSNVLLFGGDRFECTCIRRWRIRISAGTSAFQIQIFPSFPENLRSRDRIIRRIRPWPLTSKSFPFYYLWIILFDAV